MWPNVQKQTADMLGAKSSDLTGAPMYALEDELYMNNPVVIIPTLYWRAPDIRTYIVEGKPTKLYYNLHGTVLTGYDPATGKYQVTDPYNHPKTRCASYHVDIGFCYDQIIRNAKTSFHSVE